jgi:hypothetical protein
VAIAAKSILDDHSALVSAIEEAALESNRIASILNIATRWGERIKSEQHDMLATLIDLPMTIRPLKLPRQVETLVEAFRLGHDIRDLDPDRYRVICARCSALFRSLRDSINERNGPTLRAGLNKGIRIGRTRVARLKKQRTFARLRRRKWVTTIVRVPTGAFVHPFVGPQ